MTDVLGAVGCSVMQFQCHRSLETVIGEVSGRTDHLDQVGAK
jgi:hypothetical protein